MYPPSHHILLCLFVALFCAAHHAVAADVVSAASRSIEPMPPVSSGTTRALRVDDTKIMLFIEDRDFTAGHDVLREWVLQAVEIVAQYYAGFPVDEVNIAIRARPGTKVLHGQAFGGAGAIINVDVGLDATRESLDDDWILIHELIHLAFPSVRRQHHWIEEGLSVYVESIARANAGDLSADRVWSGFLRGMPNGLPKAGDKGLDHTRTWGRTYWGGALFCLLADVRIRHQTNNAKSLQDALRAIVAAGYNMTVSGDMREILEIGDRAIGVTALTELYDDMRAKPYPRELESLWSALGVAESDGRVIYDDTASLAGIRRALTQRNGPPTAGPLVMPGY